MQQEFFACRVTSGFLDASAAAGFPSFSFVILLPAAALTSTPALLLLLLLLLALFRPLLCCPQLQGMLSPFGELKDCVVIVEKMSQKSKVSSSVRNPIRFACLMQHRENLQLGRLPLTPRSCSFLHCSASAQLCCVHALKPSWCLVCLYSRCGTPATASVSLLTMRFATHNP
jgi:hypothetical protein